MLRVLTEMNQSRTYLAQAPDGGQVFLKELTFALVPDAKAVAAFTREAELLRQLHHPNIPQYVASFTAGEGAQLRLYLAETFVEGDNLEKEHLSHRYSEAELKALAAEVLEVLVFLHERTPPVLHRDLKPANLIRSKSGQVMLVDFGSARDAAARLSEGVTVTGTFGYAPPEQLAGIVTASSDVYALGATLAQLLSRRPPWELVSAGLGVDVSELPISPGLKRWLARVLEMRPQKRFATAREALTALRATARRSGVPRPIAAALALCVLGGAVGFGITEVRDWRARVREAARVHPSGTDELCPVDGILSGAAPPVGTEQFCVVNVGGQLIKNGPSVKWSRSDSMIVELAHFKDGLLDGPYEARERNQPTEQGTYSAGVRTGKWILSHPISIWEGELVAGKKVGEWSEYGAGPDGKKRALRSRGTYRDDIREGVWRSYFPDGVKVREELPFVNGVISGTETVYFESGIRSSETPKVHGVMEGVVTTWHSNGKVHTTTEYTNGQRNGASAEFLADGRKSAESFYSAGREFGTQLRFAPDGKTTSKRVFNGQGQEVSAIDYGPGGEVILDGKWENGVWQITEFYLSGAKRAEYQARAGVNNRHGPYKSWYPTGAVESEGTFALNGKVGAWKTWWPNGKLKLTEQFDKNIGGLPDGETREYFATGQLKISGSWSRGQKVGKWVEKDETGRTLTK